MVWKDCWPVKCNEVSAGKKENKTKQHNPKHHTTKNNQTPNNKRTYIVTLNLTDAFTSAHIWPPIISQEGSVQSPSPIILGSLSFIPTCDLSPVSQVFLQIFRYF